jgi:hypothetical protein
MASNALAGLPIYRSSKTGDKPDRDLQNSRVLANNGLTFPKPVFFVMATAMEQRRRQVEL